MKRKLILYSSLALLIAGAAALAQLIQGRDPVGAARASNPVVAGAVDLSGNVQPLLVSGNNALYVQAYPTTAFTAATLGQGRTAVTSAGTPVVLVGVTTLVESVEIHARKNTTTANTSNIYVGFSSSGGSNYRVLTPGEAWSISAPPGKRINLNAIYIDAATSADAVTYTSTQ